MTALSPRRTFSGTALKTIACITMLVDHIGASCIEAGILTPGLDAGTLSQDALSAYPLYRLDMVLRFTGRLAFPLFCFLLVEGFVHTHNVKGYLGRLVLFGILSEVPFDLAFFRTPFYPGAQNVYWTLALGVLAMAGRVRRAGAGCLHRLQRQRRDHHLRAVPHPHKPQVAVPCGRTAVYVRAHRPAGLCAGLVLQRAARRVQSAAKKGLLLVLPGAPAGAGRHHEPAALNLPLNRTMPDSLRAVRHCVFYGRGRQKENPPQFSRNYEGFSWRSRRDLNPRAVV